MIDERRIKQLIDQTIKEAFDKIQPSDGLTFNYPVMGAPKLGNALRLTGAASTTANTFIAYVTEDGAPVLKTFVVL